MAEQQHTCAHCGAQFMTVRCDRQRYCGDACAVLAKNAQKRAARNNKPKLTGWSRATAQPCVCAVCGVTFVPKAADRTTCCGRECGTKYAGFVVMARKTGGRVSVSIKRKKCLGCSKMHSHVNRQYCSEACAPLAYVPVMIAVCRCCGDEFTRGKAGSSRFLCSTECQVKARANAKRTSKAKRNAIERGANGGETVNPFRVFDRDGWKCQRCGRQTPKAKRGTYHKRAPELDHIIPVSRGGSHTYANTQCLCRECNAAKGATTSGQLHLFPRGPGAYRISEAI